MSWMLLLLLPLPFILLEAIMLVPPDKDHQWGKFIYFGMPGWVTDNPAGGPPVVAGIASWIMALYFNGALFFYEGSFTKAFFFWIKGPPR